MGEKLQLPKQIQADANCMLLAAKCISKLDWTCGAAVVDGGGAVVCDGREIDVTRNAGCFV